jgi:hypothetical protein
VTAWALQESVFERLNHADVTSLLSTRYAAVGGAILSDVPQAADSGDESYFPYVTIGTDTIRPYDTKDKTGGDALVLVDVWTRETSFEAAKDIAEAVDLRLRRQPLAIDGATHIDTSLVEMQAIRDPDGKTKHIAIRYRVLFLNN